MTAMPTAVRAAYTAEMVAARTSTEDTDRWAHLEAAEGNLPIAGGRARVLGFNNGVPGPTLRIRPGDRLRVTLRNRLTEPTNLHLHGLHVSPAGNGDNPFLRIEPGQDFDYQYRLLDTHPPGVYWYHPHHHGLVADQIFGGLYGAIIVDDPKPIPVTRDRVLVISDLTLDSTGRIAPASMMDRMLGREGNLVLVNGQPPSDHHCRTRHAGAVAHRQRLRQPVPAASAGRATAAVARTGLGPLPRAVTGPGNRAGRWEPCRPDGVHRGGIGPTAGAARRPGRHGHHGDGHGKPRHARYPAAWPGRNGDDPRRPGGLGYRRPTTGTARPQPTPRDLRRETVAATATFTLGMGMGMGMGAGGMRFTIDGREFDPARTDHTVRIGTVEEWTLVNDSAMDHSLHLHVWPMQLLRTGGREITEIIRQDVVNIPARSRVTVRVAFDDYPGRTVYHCHILDHEDLGMMGVIEAR